MSLIYTPAGKAREYSPLALNIYNGCDFGCKYCYTKIISKNENSNQVAKEREDFLIKLSRELKKNKYLEQILLSFMCDPYCDNELNGQHLFPLTQHALKQLNNNNCLVAVLTKSGTRCLRDLEIFKTFGNRIKVGATLTLIDENQSKEIEPNAASPAERIEMLKILHDNNIKTFASMEPVIDPAQSLQLIEKTINFTDGYKIGKMNHFESKFCNSINWTNFLYKAVEIMRKNNKKFYIKEDLRTFDIDKILTCEESDMNALNLKLLS
jgi:DNA repair photolyase